MYRRKLIDNPILFPAGCAVFFYVLLRIRNAGEGLDGLYMAAVLPATVTGAALLWLFPEMEAMRDCVFLMYEGLALQSFFNEATAKMTVIPVILGLAAAFAAWRFTRCEAEKTCQTAWLLCAAGIAAVCAMLVTVKIVTGGSVQAGVRGKQISLLIPVMLAGYIAGIYSCEKVTEKRKLIFSAAAFLLIAVSCVIVSEMGCILISGFVFITGIYLNSDLLRQPLAVIAVLLILAVTAIWLLDIISGRLGSDGSASGPGSAIISLNGKIQSRLHTFGYDLTSANYQIRQAEMAIIVAGLFGTSDGYYVPYGSTDMPFAVAVQRFGLIIAFITVMCVVKILLTTVKLADRDNFHSRFSAIALSSLCFEAIYGILMNCGCVSIVGIPTMFLSRGGSYLMITMFTISFAALTLKENSFSGPGRIGDGTEGADHEYETE